MRIPVASPATCLRAIAAAGWLTVGGEVGARTAQLPPAPPAAPPAAYSVGAAYDAARQRLVVFGGYLKGAYQGDTWE